MAAQTKDMVSAVIVAGGKGERLGSDIPKAFVPLANKPMAAYSLATFAAHALVRDIVIVAPPDWLEMAREMIADAPAQKEVRIVAGGKERWQSVQNGVLATDPQCDWVMVHDAARPFVTAAVIDSLLDKRQSFECAFTATPVVDTIRSFENDRCTGVVDRSKLVRVGTPQLFKKRPLIEAFALAPAMTLPPTDEVMLMEKKGSPVAFAWGDPMNFKITTPHDLEIAKAILRERDLAL